MFDHSDHRSLVSREREREKTVNSVNDFGSSESCRRDIIITSHASMACVYYKYVAISSDPLDYYKRKVDASMTHSPSANSPAHHATLHGKDHINTLISLSSSLCMIVISRIPGAVNAEGDGEGNGGPADTRERADGVCPDVLDLSHRLPDAVARDPSVRHRGHHPGQPANAVAAGPRGPRRLSSQERQALPQVRPHVPASDGGRGTRTGDDRHEHAREDKALHLSLML